MAMTIHCDIVSAEQEIFSGLAELVVATGSLGEVGINFGHAPLLTDLRPGPVRVIKPGGEEEIFYVSGGYMEVQPTVISILADTAIRADDVDEAAAIEAQKLVEAELANQSADFDYSQAAVRLAEASAQLRTLQKIRKNISK